MTPHLTKLMEEMAEKFQLQFGASPPDRSFKAGFTAAVKAIKEQNKDAREFWVLEDEVNFGNFASSDPRDHAAQTVLFRIPICTDRPELAIRLREVKND